MVTVSTLNRIAPSVSVAAEQSVGHNKETVAARGDVKNNVTTEAVSTVAETGTSTSPAVETTTVSKTATTTSTTPTPPKEEKKSSSSLPKIDGSAPLPTSRQLSRLLCRVVDDDAYGTDIAQHTLRQLEAWANSSSSSNSSSSGNTKSTTTTTTTTSAVGAGHSDKDLKRYVSDFVAVGGVRACLCYTQDHLLEQECVRTAISCLVSMMKIMTINDNEKIMTEISTQMVELGGVSTLLCAYKIHALSKNVQELIDEDDDDIYERRGRLLQEDEEEEGSFRSDEEEDVVVVDQFITPAELLMQMLGFSSQAVVDESRDDDHDDKAGIVASLRDGSLEIGSFAFLDMMPTCSSPSMLLQRGIVDDETDKNRLVITQEAENMSVETALCILQAIQLLIPYAPSDQVSKIFSVVCKNIHLLTKNEDLMESASTTLVSIVKENRSTRIVIDDPVPKEITRITVDWMKLYPSNNVITKNGCLLLQGVCPNLPKADRKRLGVIAVLGSVLASDTLSKDVKEAADIILEKQIR